MREEIRKLLDCIDMNIKKLSNNLSEENYEMVELDIDIKHILEDMGSILDYIAVNIYKKYCGYINGKKVYFPYSKENEDENLYISKVNKNFPNLISEHYDLYKLLSDVQAFSDNSKWLIKLKDLTNEVKHNKLCIAKVAKERNIVMKSDDTSMHIKGDLNIQKNQKGYAIYGKNSLYVYGQGKVCFYSNGIITVGNGIYNIDKKSSNNIDTKIYYEKILKSKKYDENIIDMLKLIFNKELQFALKIENMI